MENYTGDTAFTLHKNLSLLLIESFKRTLIVWASETAVFCLEIGILFDFQVLALILPSKVLRYLQQWEVTSVAGSDLLSNLGYQITDPTCLIILLILVNLVLGGAIYRMSIPRPTGSSQEYTKLFSAVTIASKDRPLYPDDIFWFLLRYAIYLAPYLARLFILFFWAAISCTPVVKELALRGDDRILPTSNDQLALILSVFKNAIIHESTLLPGQQCYSGNQIILTFGWIIVGIEMVFFLVIHHRVADFISNPEVILAKQSQWMEWLDFGLFTGMYLLKVITTKYLEKSVAPFIPWIMVVHQVCMYIFMMLYKPYYSMSLLNWRIFKHILLGTSGLWILILQRSGIKGGLGGEMTLLKFEIFWFVVISLFVGFVARLSMQRIKLSDLQARLTNQLILEKYGSISLSDVKLLVYVFYLLRNSVSSEKPATSNELVMSRIRLVFWQLFIAHRSKCNDKGCLCTSRYIYLRSVKLHRMDANLMPEFKWITEIIFACQFILDKKLASVSGELMDLKSNHSFTKFFTLWSVFSVQNYGNTLTILSLLSKMLKQDIAEAKTRTSKNDGLVTFLFTKSWRVSVLRSYLKTTIEMQSKYVDFNPWSSVYANSSFQESDGSKSEMSWVTNQFVTVNEYLNDLQITAETISDAIACKIDYLTTISSHKRSKVLEHTDQYLENCAHVERMCIKLKLPNQMVFFKSMLMQVSYLLKVKEDMIAGKQLLARSAMSQVSSNVLSSLESSKISKAIVLIIGAEAENLHQVVGCTSNSKDWGYELSELVGNDLNCLLPEVVSSFHKPMLHKAFRETGWNSQILETRVPLAQGVISATGDYIPTTIYIKLNCLLMFGFQMFGFCVPRLEAAPVELVVDSMGIIKHLTKSARSIFKEHTSFLQHSRVLTGLLQKLTAIELDSMQAEVLNHAKCSKRKKPQKVETEKVWSPEQQLNSILETDMWLPLGLVANDQQQAGPLKKVRLRVRITENYKTKSLFYNLQFMIDPSCPSLNNGEENVNITSSVNTLDREIEEKLNSGSKDISKLSCESPKATEILDISKRSVPGISLKSKKSKISNSRKVTPRFERLPDLNAAHRMLSRNSVVVDGQIAEDVGDAITEVLKPHTIIAYLNNLPEPGMDSPREVSQIYARLHLRSGQQVDRLSRVLSSGLSNVRMQQVYADHRTSFLNLTRAQSGMLTSGRIRLPNRRNAVVQTQVTAVKLQDLSKVIFLGLTKGKNTIRAVFPRNNQNESKTAFSSPTKTSDDPSRYFII